MCFAHYKSVSPDFWEDSLLVGVGAACDLARQSRRTYKLCTDTLAPTSQLVVALFTRRANINTFLVELFYRA